MITATHATLFKSNKTQAHQWFEIVTLPEPIRKTGILAIGIKLSPCNAGWTIYDPRPAENRTNSSKALRLLFDGKCLRSHGKQKETVMKKSVLMMCVLALCAWSVPALAESSVGDVSVKMSVSGAGTGFKNGSATVKLNGKTGNFKVSGFHLLGSGISKFKATGKVIGAKSLDDIAGEYSVSWESSAMRADKVNFNLLNDRKDVTMDISAENLGPDFAVGPGTITFSRQ